ncbi:hypothetical protein DENSPDRAFT_844721 [Dentipellis sp. KUC8613]|nr:hypothetical protein DENSPDRAFT_844721 [Dentipellis sp. KUC8613]
MHPSPLVLYGLSGTCRHQQATYVPCSFLGCRITHAIAVPAMFTTVCRDMHMLGLVNKIQILHEGYTNPSMVSFVRAQLQGKQRAFR